MYGYFFMKMFIHQYLSIFVYFTGANVQWENVTLYAHMMMLSFIPHILHRFHPLQRTVMLGDCAFLMYRNILLTLPKKITSEVIKYENQIVLCLKKGDVYILLGIIKIYKQSSTIVYNLEKSVITLLMHVVTEGNKG